MFKKLLLSLLGLSVIFLAQNNAFAGGGRVVIEMVENRGYVGEHGIRVSARIYNEDHSQMIQGEEAEFRIENPRKGDRCEATRPISSEWGQVFGVCFAEQPGEVLIYVHLKNSNYDSSRAILYFYDRPATPIPTNTPALTLYYTGMQKDAGGPKRYSSLKWNSINGTTKYNVYVRRSDQAYDSALLGTSLTYSDIGINKTFDYYAKVEACTQPTNCVKSNEVFIPKMEETKNEEKTEPTIKYEETSSSIKDVEKPNIQDVEELNKKVSSLEKKVEKSEKRQNILEAKIEDLLFWIKSHFFFF